MKLIRLAALLTAPLFLASCLLTPGKFTASLDIHKDRSFTFAYQGEVIMLDPTADLQQGLGSALSSDEPGKKAELTVSPPAKADPSAQMVTQRKAVLEALSREQGYRSVEYLGGNKFRVDYQVAGRLDRNFAYPLNLDAMAIVPWIAVELRKDGTARMMAIAFGDSSSTTPGMGAAAPKPDMAAAEREGIFTFTTDATLVMQNNEAGVAPGPGTKVVWHITPTTKAVPTAVVRF